MSTLRVYYYLNFFCKFASEKLYISENCVSEKLGDEVIVLDINSGLYHSLNEIGFLIWREIENKNPTDKELIDFLKLTYDDEKVSVDCELFLAELFKKKLIYMK